MAFLEKASTPALCFALGVLTHQGYIGYVKPPHPHAIHAPSPAIETSAVSQAIKGATVEQHQGEPETGQRVTIKVGGETGQVFVTQSGQVWLGPSYSKYEPLSLSEANPTDSTTSATESQHLTQISPEQIESERQRFIDYAKKAASIQIKPGDKPVYVFFDADCSYCHQLFKELHTDGLAQKQGLAVSWIPISIFNSELSKAGATTLVKMLETNGPKAVDTFAAFMTGKKTELDLDSLNTHKNTIELNTALFVAGVSGNPAAGSPLVVFKNAQGKVEFYPYKPDLSVFSSVGK